jgi:UDP-sulfoquinovose synthase
MTKTLDQLMFAFYAKNDRLRVTDLHQGIVWGTETGDTRRDEALINRFDYDGDYGTVLNRFLAQAAVDYPLTVHGSGGQTRAFINVQDTVRCIELAVESPPQRGERVKIMNQMTECHTVLGLAEMVSGMTGVPIEHVENPRKEAAENELLVSNSSLIGLGLKPITLEGSLASEVMNVAKKYAHNIDKSKMAWGQCGRVIPSVWRPWFGMGRAFQPGHRREKMPQRLPRPVEGHEVGNQVVPVLAPLLWVMAL